MATGGEDNTARIFDLRKRGVLHILPGAWRLVVLVGGWVARSGRAAHPAGCVEVGGGGWVCVWCWWWWVPVCGGGCGVGWWWLGDEKQG